MAKTLPSAITSYDLIKAAAVIIMICDHIGFYFFPEDEWWRAFGRIGFPVWFFFVGHASGREISPKLWGGMLILIVSSLMVGMPLFPVNALMTIILIRILLDPMMDVAGRSMAALGVIIAGLALLSVPTTMVMEYGTMGLLFALFGYIVRRRDTFMASRAVQLPVMMACFIIFTAQQQMMFGFDTNAFLFMAAGTLATCALMMHFQPREYPGLSARMPGGIRAVIQLMGRRTLEIYVIHLVLFKVAAAILYPQTYPLFQFRLFW